MYQVEYKVDSLHERKLSGRHGAWEMETSLLRMYKNRFWTQEAQVLGGAACMLVMMWIPGTWCGIQHTLLYSVMTTEHNTWYDDMIVVFVVLTLSHGYNAVRGHRTGSNNSGAEDYLRRKTNKKQHQDNTHHNWNKSYAVPQTKIKGEISGRTVRIKIHTW